MSMYRLSAHFNEMWKKRVGGRLPTTREVNRLIDESVRLQKFNSLYTSRGHYVKIPMLCWHASQNLFFKIDKAKGVVVTVLNERCAKEMHQG